MTQNTLPGIIEETSESDRDSWATPKWLFDRLDKEFNFVADMAAEPWSAKCKEYYTKERNSLSENWAWISCELRGFLFCNPPFSDLETWTHTAAKYNLLGACVVMVLPAHRCEQSWFQIHVIGRATEVRMIPKRVAYVPPPGVEASTPSFPSMVVVWNGINASRTTELRSL